MTHKKRLQTYFHSYICFSCIAYPFSMNFSLITVEPWEKYENYCGISYEQIDFFYFLSNFQSINQEPAKKYHITRKQKNFWQIKVSLSEHCSYSNRECIPIEKNLCIFPLKCYLIELIASFWIQITHLFKYIGETLYSMKES